MPSGFKLRDWVGLISRSAGQFSNYFWLLMNPADPNLSPSPSSSVSSVLIVCMISFYATGGFLFTNSIPSLQIGLTITWQLYRSLQRILHGSFKITAANRLVQDYNSDSPFQHCWQDYRWRCLLVVWKYRSTSLRLHYLFPAIGSISFSFPEGIRYSLQCCTIS